MKISIDIPSSTYNSDGKLIINNIDENEDEILLTIEQNGEEMCIYVMAKQLKNALNKICA
jgi:hypothetical protein